MQTIVLVTGGFDPLHSGHVAYLESARKLGDRLVVGVNSDLWLARKKGRSFMPWSERANIVANIRHVDEIIEFDDWDGSARAAIHETRRRYPDARIIFANGGDRTKTNIPEMDVVDPNLRFEFGIGGSHKANSSSWILEEWKSPKTARPWGFYKVIYDHSPTVKVKELVVEPGKRLSMQRHKDRTEIWFVVQGIASVFTLDDDNEVTHSTDVSAKQNIMIHQDRWHQLANLGNQPLSIIEIQYGSRCDEADIERFTQAPE